MKRNEFIKKIGLGCLSVPFLHSCSVLHYTENVEDCKFTDQDDLGPFFVKGTDKVVNLNDQNLPGTPMKVSGFVYGGEGRSTPLAGVKIEIWHCDDAGAYHPNGSGDVNDYDHEEVTLRGFVTTDENGAFSFKSILPGLYARRARHIHYKLTAKKYQNLTTQSYFKNDPRIPYDILAQNAGDCRILEFKSDEDGMMYGEMIFNLEK